MARVSAVASAIMLIAAVFGWWLTGSVHNHQSDRTRERRPEDAAEPPPKRPMGSESAETMSSMRQTGVSGARVLYRLEDAAFYV